MKTKVKFTLPAGNIIGAAECVLLGEFNNWNLDDGYHLQKQEDGSMSAEVELPAGRSYQYRYLLSNGRWVNDEGEKISSDISGYPVLNCLIRVPGMVEATIVSQTETVKVKTVPKERKFAKEKPAVVKEDLTRIEGIGKKIEALLYKNKIYSYQQLSKSTIKSLKQLLEAAGNKVSMHDPGTWPKQAKLAAAAKWEELDAMQQQLKGGK
ncbi:MAG TPA: glycoside hydrolase family 13 [Ferruginibacter sp.]|nr:glycoside hydrolase family 13 [Ferruginibacter sp.]